MNIKKEKIVNIKDTGLGKNLQCVYLEILKEKQENIELKWYLNI